MPIIVKDFTWRQTEQTVTLRVPLHGVNKSRTDLLTTPTYLRCTFGHFYFECFLLHPVNVNASKCTLNDTDIVYELCKEEPVLWETLEKVLSKEKKREIIFQSRDEEEKRLNAEKNARLVKQQELKRCAVSEAVAFDTQQRNAIEAIRTAEKSKALGNLQKWQKKLEAPKKIKSLKAKPEALQIPIPLPRRQQVVDIEFTERVLPTPSRESREEEETEWLQKMAEARRSVGFAGEDLRPEERNPHYLLGKGLDFIKNANYLGAISAYTFGIQICPAYVDLYIARSEAHFSIGNYHKTIQDCSKAMEMMKPEVSANLEQRAICVGRRGIALHKIEMRKHAIDELKASIKLKPMREFEEYLDLVQNEPENQEKEDAEPGLEIFNN